jgi:putative transposon-encoded protein
LSRKIFVLNNSMTLKDDEIEGILERTVTKQGTSAKADVPRRYLGRRVYVIITKSKGEVRDEE